MYTEDISDTYVLYGRCQNKQKADDILITEL